MKLLPHALWALGPIFSAPNLLFCAKAKKTFSSLSRKHLGVKPTIRHACCQPWWQWSGVFFPAPSSLCALCGTCESGLGLGLGFEVVAVVSKSLGTVCAGTIGTELFGIEKESGCQIKSPFFCHVLPLLPPVNPWLVARRIPRAHFQSVRLRYHDDGCGVPYRCCVSGEPCRAPTPFSRTSRAISWRSTV